MIIKQNSRIRLRTFQRINFVVGSISILALALILYFYVIIPEEVYSATTGDYRSIATGNWNATSTWETYNGTSWISASTTPTSSDGLIEIQSGHTVTAIISVTADQIKVNAGGTLNILAGKTLTLANGASDDLTVNGIMNISGTLAAQASSSIIDSGTITLTSGGVNTFAAGSTISINNGALYKAQSISCTTTSNIWTINSGGTFQYDANGGSLPLAIWNTGSTCLVTGITSTILGNLTQSFYNFTYNCPGQSGTEKLSGFLTTVNGNFTMISSGTGRLRFTQQENFTLSIGGNFYMQGGLLYVSCKGTADSILVTGNYIQTGGTFGLTDGTTEGGVTPTFMTVTDFNISNGTFDMTSNVGSSNGNGVTTLNINSNFSQTGGTVTETATTGVNFGFGKIYFVKSGTQIFTKLAGTMSNNINITVNNGSILNMSTYFPTGAGSFSVLSGGALLLASTEGITSTSLNGNVQVTGTRSYSNSANYTYNAIGPQVSGDGLPASVNNLTIDNTNHVTLTNTVSVGGILTLANGQIVTNTNELIITNSATTSVNGHSLTNYVRGNLRRYVNASGSYDFPVGTSSNYEYINVTLTGMTGFTNILSSFTNSNPFNSDFPISGINVFGTDIDSLLNYGYWTLTPNNPMASGNYSVTLKEKGFSNAANSPAGYCVLKRENSTSSWQSIGTHNIPTQFESNGVATAVRSGLTSFSQFSIGKTTKVGGLPIKLIYFNVVKRDNVVNLSWATGSEINNDYFTIERSIDGIKFEPILRKKGAGNSTITLKYTDVDENPMEGVSYYRLKQTDYDNHFTYSEVKSIKFSPSQNNEGAQTLKLISISPNPFNESFICSFKTNTNSRVEFQLLNSSGQIVAKDIINSSDGINQYQYNNDKNLQPGIYLAVLLCNNERIVTKLLKK